MASQVGSTSSILLIVTNLRIYFLVWEMIFFFGFVLFPFSFGLKELNLGKTTFFFFFFFFYKKKTQEWLITPLKNSNDWWQLHTFSPPHTSTGSIRSSARDASMASPWGSDLFNGRLTAFFLWAYQFYFDYTSNL